jgi:ketosteroid isomerase-like protein
MTEKTERQAIEQVVMEAYIRGIHGDQDEARVRSGFHPDFAMLVPKDDSILKVSVGEWLERIEGMKASDPELWRAETTCDFLIVDATRNAAVVKLDVFKDAKRVFTDYMLLYKFAGGWKVVSKVFASHR